MRRSTPSAAVTAYPWRRSSPRTRRLVPERLRAGMKVWVPAKNAPTPQQPPPPPAKQPSQPKIAEGTTPSRGHTHVVKENESIALIAKKYAVSESSLLRENKLTADDPIYVDDVLKIPSGGATTASASSPTKTGTPPTKPTASNTKTGTTPTKPAASAPSPSRGWQRRRTRSREMAPSARTS